MDVSADVSPMNVEVESLVEGNLEEQQTDEVKLAVEASADVPPGFVEWEAVRQNNIAEVMVNDEPGMRHPLRLEDIPSPVCKIAGSGRKDSLRNFVGTSGTNCHRSPYGELLLDIAKAVLTRFRPKSKNAGGKRP